MGLRRVMAKKGYEGASIADVAKSARLTTGLVHYHYKNKQEILLAVVAGFARETEKNLLSALAETDGEPKSELLAFIDYFLALGPHADPEMVSCWIFLCGEALRQNAVRQAVEGTIEARVLKLEQIISRGVGAKQFSCENEHAAAVAIYAAIQGYFVMSGTALGLIPVGSAAPHVRAMALGMLTAKPR